MKRTSRSSLGTVPRNNEVANIISSSATNEALEKIIDGKELEMVNFEKQIQQTFMAKINELQEKNEPLINQLSAYNFILD